jgi:hypothetical protein
MVESVKESVRWIKEQLFSPSLTFYIYYIKKIIKFQVLRICCTYSARSRRRMESTEPFAEINL